jgi:hypothetical protein
MAEDQRHSQASDAEIVTDPEAVARREAANGLRQVDAVNEMVEYWLQPQYPFKLRSSHLLKLNRIALEGLVPMLEIFVQAPSKSGEVNTSLRTRTLFLNSWKRCAIT